MQSDKIVECHPKKIQNNKEYGLNVRKKKTDKNNRRKRENHLEHIHLNNESNLITTKKINKSIYITPLGFLVIGKCSNQKL